MGFNKDCKVKGVFLNGLAEDAVADPLTFIADGAVSQDDCRRIKRLIERERITMQRLQIPNYNNDDTHYALLFAEVLKLWLLELAQPLLQELPSTFFDGITC